MGLEDGGISLEISTSCGCTNTPRHCQAADGLFYRLIVPLASFLGPLEFASQPTNGFRAAKRLRSLAGPETGALPAHSTVVAVLGLGVFGRLYAIGYAVGVRSWAVGELGSW